MPDYVATSCRARMDEYFVYLTYSCGEKDGLVQITMTKADYKRDFVDPVMRKISRNWQVPES